MERQKQKKRVLIVEDAPYMSEMIGDMLDPEEYEIVGVAVNGIEAVRNYKELDPKPDIVTMDVVMEEMDGIQAIKEIRKYDQDARIIVISALSASKDRDAAMDAGANEYLWKPFTVKKLSKIFEKVLTVNKGD